MPGRQQHRQPCQRLRKLRNSGLVHQGRWPVPVDRRFEQTLARQAQTRVVRCGLPSQHQVQVVQRQFAQQLLEFALMAQQPQRRRRQHRGQQRVRGQFGDAVGPPDGQACDLAAVGLANLVGDDLPELEDLLGAGVGRLARFGHRHTSAGRLEQLVSEGLLQFPHLRADGLHRHAQPLGRASETAFLGDDPGIAEVAVVQHAAIRIERTEVALTLPLVLSDCTRTDDSSSHPAINSIDTTVPHPDIMTVTLMGLAFRAWRIGSERLDGVPYKAISAPFCRHLTHQDEFEMPHAPSWFLVSSLLALWSLATRAARRGRLGGPQCKLADGCRIGCCFGRCVDRGTPASPGVAGPLGAAGSFAGADLATVGFGTGGREPASGRASAGQRTDRGDLGPLGYRQRTADLAGGGSVPAHPGVAPPMRRLRGSTDWAGGRVTVAATSPRATRRRH